MVIDKPSQGQATAGNLVVGEPSQGQAAASDMVVDEPSQEQEPPRADPVASKSATVARAEVKYTTHLELAQIATQDLEDEGLHPESAENERIQRLLLKIPKYEKTMEKIKSLHSEYLKFTALDKPDSFLYCPTTLRDAVQWS